MQRNNKNIFVLLLILAELKSQYVINVYKFKRWENGILTPTGTILLAFETPNLSDTVNVGFERFRTRQYIPTPM